MTTGRRYLLELELVQVVALSVPTASSVPYALDAVADLAPLATLCAALAGVPALPEPLFVLDLDHADVSVWI